MNCSICENGELKAGFATVTLERSGSVVVIRNVPALVCDNCEATSYDGDVTEKTLELAEAVLTKGVDVVLLHYPAEQMHFDINEQLISVS